MTKIKDFRALRSIALKNAAKIRHSDKLVELEADAIVHHTDTRFIAKNKIRCLSWIGRDLAIESLFHIDDLMADKMVSAEM